MVASVTGWGFYVQLPNGAEGLVHISGLDDYYEYDRERGRLVGSATGTVFKLGDRVRVRVERVNVPLGEINFQLAPPRKTRRSPIVQRLCKKRCRKALRFPDMDEGCVSLSS